MHVLVTGATGFVGSRLVPALREDGHDVTVLVRDAGEYEPPDETIGIVEGDLLDPESFSADAFDGESFDAAYYLVHSMRTGGDFAERDHNAARNFVQFTDAVGVDRIVYLGGLGEEGEQLSAHLESRREVERVLASASASLTTLRAAIIIGAGSTSFEMICQLSSRLPIMVTPRWVHTHCQPIAIDDVLAYLVGVLDHPETADDTYEIGGPDVLTYAEILKRTAGMMGHRLRIVSVPVLTPRLSSYWVGLVSDVPASVARPLIEGLRNPVVVTDHRLQELLGVDRTSFDRAVERALGPTGAGEGEDENQAAGESTGRHDD